LGSSIAGVARSHAVSKQTLYRWRERYARITKGELAELKKPQDEHGQLRSLVASKALDIEAYRELQKGKL
jgi:transposase-like protein